MNRLLEMIDIVAAVPPVDLNTTVAGDYVSLKNYAGCLVLVTKGVGTAGDDISLQLFQAQDVAATGEKALTFNHVYHKIGALLSAVETWTRIDLTTATGDLDTVSVNGVDLLADDTQAMFAIDVKADSLDVTNGFDCICFKNDGGDVGNAALGSVHYILYGPRHAGATPQTAIID